MKPKFYNILGNPRLEGKKKRQEKKRKEKKRFGFSRVALRTGLAASKKTEA